MQRPLLRYHRANLNVYTIKNSLMSNNGKKTIAELRRDQKDQILDADKMDKVTGGKRSDSWLRRMYNNIIPQ